MPKRTRDQFQASHSAVAVPPRPCSPAVRAAEALDQIRRSAKATARAQFVAGVGARWAADLARSEGDPLLKRAKKNESAYVSRFNRKIYMGMLAKRLAAEKRRESLLVEKKEELVMEIQKRARELACVQRGVDFGMFCGQGVPRQGQRPQGFTGGKVKPGASSRCVAKEEEVEVEVEHVQQVEMPRQEEYFVASDFIIESPLPSEENSELDSYFGSSIDGLSEEGSLCSSPNPPPMLDDVVHDEPAGFDLSTVLESFRDSPQECDTVNDNLEPLFLDNGGELHVAPQFSAQLPPPAPTSQPQQRLDGAPGLNNLAGLSFLQDVEKPLVVLSDAYEAAQQTVQEFPTTANTQLA